MAQQTLDKKPGHEYDSDGNDGSAWRPPGYDKDNSGYDEKNPESKATKSINEQEAGASSNDGQSSSVSEKESNLNKDTIGKGFREDNRPKKKSKLSVKQQLGLGGGVLGVSVFTVMLFSFIQGPFQVVQISKLLEKFHFSSIQNMGDDRTSNITTLYRYARTGTIQGTRLGAVGRKSASIAEARMIQDTGLRPVYNSATGQMSGFEILDENKSKKLVDELVDVDGATRGTVSSVGLTDVDGNAISNNIVEFDGDSSNKIKRRAQAKVIRETKLNKISSTVAGRLLSRLGGIKANFSPLGKLKKSASQSFLQYKASYKEKLESDIDTGNNKPIARDLEARSSNVDADGNPITDPGDVDAARVGNESRQISQDALDSDLPGSRNTKLFNVGKEILGKAAGPAAVVGVLCAVRDLGNQAEEIQYANTILPMIRIGVRWISMGSQLESLNDLDLDEINVNIQDLYDPETGDSFMAAASVQYENDLPPTGKDLDPAVRPSGVNGKPVLLEAIDKIPALPTACGVGNFISSLPVIKQVGNVSEGIINRAASAAGLPNPEELMFSIATWLSGEALNKTPVASELGNIANYGAKLAANNQYAGMGGVELTEQEVAELDEHNEQIRREELEGESFFARMFDIENVDSLVSVTVQKSPHNFIDLVPKVDNIASLLSSPLNMLGGVASAQPNYSYDYGFADVGFTLSEQNNPLVQDPYLNAEYVEENIVNLSDEYGKCFPVTFNTSTLDIVIDTSEKAVSQFNQPDECRRYNGSTLGSSTTLGNSTDFLRYRMYLFDSVTAHSLACFDGENESCRQIGFDSESPNSASTPTNTGTGEILALNGLKIGGLIQTDSVAESCTGGLQEGPKVIADFIKERWGKSYGGYDCRGKSTNSSSLSIHSEGRAIDQSYNAFDITELREGNETFGWLLANAESIGVQYVKFWKLQWSPNNGLRCVLSRSDVATHSNHIHYELNRSASRLETPWFTNPTDNTPYVINQDLCP